MHPPPRNRVRACPLAHALASFLLLGTACTAVPTAAATAVATAAAPVRAATVDHPAAPAPQLPLRPRGATGPLTTERLSDERSLTRWATPAAVAWVRARPRISARRIVRLHYQSETGHDEVYVVLRARVTDTGTWLFIRVPRRPNGTTGWVPVDAMGPLHEVRTSITVNRRRLQLTLRRDGKVVLRAPVGIGAPATPTPRGDFWIREKFRRLRGGTIYGPYAMGTSDYSTLSEWPLGGVVGIHGTNEPALVPGRPSHGCIRMHDRDVTRLWRRVAIGTPVHVL